MTRAAVWLLLCACVLPWARAARAGEEEPVPVERLLRDLSSADYQTRRRAVLASEGRTEPELVERLFEIARSDGHPNIRGYAAETLALLDDPRVFDLLATMATREAYGVRHSAYVALGRHGDVRARRILLAGLRAERGTRAYAAKGLGLLGDASAFPAILEVYLAHLDDPYLQDLGAEALFQLDGAAARTRLLPRFATLPGPARLRLARLLGAHATPAVTRALVGHLAAEDRSLRHAAILGLEIAGDPRAVEPLLACLRAWPDEAIGAIKALGVLGDARAVPALVARLAREADDAVVRAYAIQALARIGDRRAVGGLVACLTDARETRQPREISAIWGFPYNARVDAAAVWAIRTILDGKKPFGVEKISRFPDPVLPAEVGAEIPRIRAWWRDLPDRSPYVVDEDD